MDNINFRENKVIVFEKGEPVFFGKDGPDVLHVDLIAEYIDKKLKSDEFKDNQMLQILKNSQVTLSMAGQVLFLTNAVMFLNLGWAAFVMFKNDATLEDLQVIKDNAEKIDAFGDVNLFKMGVVKDDQGRLYVEDEMIEDDNKLPLDERIDNFLNNSKGRGR
jgi:hypothetical protein